MRNKEILIGIILFIALGFGYYTISPLFRTIEIDDTIPGNIIVENEEEIMDNLVPSGFEDLTNEEQKKMLAEMEEVNKTPMPEVNDSMPEIVVEEKKETMEQGSDPVEDNMGSFPVMGTLGHPASGHVRLIQTTTGTILRYEDFSTINGPRLHLYLAKDLKANDFLDLGPIKGTQGNINYQVPEGVNISEYRYAMYWCVPFGVLFNYAEIN